MNHTPSWYHARLVRAALALFRPLSAPGLTFALGFYVACTPPAQGPLPGASEAWKKPSDAAPAPPAPPQSPWAAYAEVKQWPALNPAPFVSRGHQPEGPVDVRVSPESRAIYSGLVADSVFPEGSVLAELPHGAGARGYGMQKISGAWRFFELNAAGEVISSGALSLCAGCHAQAPADSVFGLPRLQPLQLAPEAGSKPR